MIKARKVVGESRKKDVVLWKKDDSDQQDLIVSEDLENWLACGVVYIYCGVNGEMNLEKKIPDSTNNTIIGEFGVIQASVHSYEEEDIIKFIVAWNPGSSEPFNIIFTPNLDAFKEMSSHIEIQQSVIFNLEDIYFEKIKKKYKPLKRNCLGKELVTPKIILFKKAPISEKTDLLAIDFGTHETHIATLGGGSSLVHLLPHTVPWFHMSIQLNKTGENLYKPQAETHFFNGLPLPLPIQKVRTQFKNDDERNIGIPSQSLEIPREKRGHQLFNEIALGDDCFSIINNCSSSDERLDILRKLRPSPKLFIGTEFNTPSKNQEILEENSEIAVFFLKELLSSLAENISRNQDINALRNGDVFPKREIRTILYSYPVSFTIIQRENLHESLNKAIAHSKIYQYVKTPVNQIPLADEGTASAMGVLMHQFGSLSPNFILNARRPFTTFPIPKRKVSDFTMRILCADLGGGTTDIVLLRLNDGKVRKKDGIKITVEKTFGYPRAGLAVTQKIAAILKIKAAKAAKGSDQEDLINKTLNTNFEEESENHTANKTRIMLYNTRRGRTFAWYRIAENIKIKMSTENVDSIHITDEDVKDIGLEGFVKASSIYMTKEEFGRITEEIFSCALDEISEWLLNGIMIEKNGKKETIFLPIDLITLTGRSFRLPDLRKRMFGIIKKYNEKRKENIPESGRLHAHNIVDINWLEENHGILDELHIKGKLDYDKALVPLGLFQLFDMCHKSAGGFPFEFEKTDDARRNRYIGVLVKVYERHTSELEVDPDLMLVNNDNEPVTDDLIKISSINPETHEWAIGINFNGPTGNRLSDPARILAVIKIFKKDSPNLHDIETLDYYFVQTSATRVKLVKIKYQNISGAPIETNKEHLTYNKETNETVISVDGLTVKFLEKVVFDDFRTDGRIDSGGIDVHI